MYNVHCRGTVMCVLYTMQCIVHNKWISAYYTKYATQCILYTLVYTA